MGLPLKKLLLRYLPPPVLLALKKRYYARALKGMGTADERDLTVVEKLVRRGDHAVDIGANIGLYTKTLSEIVGDTGRVYSIEPIPLTFRILTYCTRALRLANVRLLQTAVSDAPGVVTMVVPKLEGYDFFTRARISNRGASSSQQRTFNVKKDTLDSILADVVGRVAFVKCDVEGHEWPVLLGAPQLLSKSSAAWLIELSGNPDDHASSANAVIKHMRGLGYEVYWYDGSALRRRVKGDASVNYFFLKPVHVERLMKADLSIVE